MNNWTEEQLQAINTRGANLLVSAAAGSGKTAVLVERIIRMITSFDNPVDIDRMLIMTFTNAAASEMRDKISRAIGEALSKDPQNKNLKKQLALIQRANISTIHSFCLSVIRSNFHLIDVEPNFKVADDVEMVLLKEEIMEELLFEKYQGEDSTFLDLVESYSLYRDQSSIGGMVLSIYEFIMNMALPFIWLKASVEEFNPNSFTSVKECSFYEPLMENLILKLRGALENLKKAENIINGDPSIDFYSDNISCESEALTNILQNIDAGEDIDEASLSIIFSKNLKRASGSYDKDNATLVKKKRDEAKEGVLDVLDTLGKLKEEEIKEQFNTLYPLLCCMYDLTRDFYDRFSEKKREKGLMDFNDIEHFCLKILCNIEEDKIVPSEVSKVYREKFQEVFVDEYQDSNLVQEVIMKAVSRWDEPKPNLFMVGDVKQSIYRFRGGKPELFMEKYNSFSKEKNSINRKINLHKNFRSKEEILSCVNFLFKSIMSKNIGELDYTAEEELNFGAGYYEEGQHKESPLSKGRIELHILDRDEEKIEEEAISQNETIEMQEDEEESLDNIRLEGRYIAKRIGEILDPNNKDCAGVYDKKTKEYRKATYGDIVILLRATKNFGVGIAEELKASGIPVYSDSSNGYFDTLEIRTMVSLMQVIDNPRQDIPLLAILRSPIFGFTEGQLARIKTCNENNVSIIDGSFYEYLMIKAEEKDDLGIKCSSFIDKINIYRKEAAYMEIDKLVWHLIMDTGYYGYVGAMENGYLRQANLRILFQRASKYNNSSLKGLFNFINFINKVKLSSKDMGSAKLLSENEDVVRIMSIHKSKGLEFPIVILGGTGKLFNKMDLRENLMMHDKLGIGPLFVDSLRRISYDTIMKKAIKYKVEIENLSEEQRILYVAMTRAQERLIITGSLKNLQRVLENTYKEVSRESEENYRDIVPLSYNSVAKSRCYLQWIIAAFMNHKEAGSLRDAARDYSSIDSIETPDESTLNIKIIKRGEIELKAEKEKEDEKQGEAFLDVDADTLKEVYRRLSYKYPYDKFSKIPAKVTVSELKNSLMRDDEAKELFSELNMVKLPSFMLQDKKLTGALRGTAFHEVMRAIKLEKTQSLKDIEEELIRMEKASILNKEQTAAISLEGIYKFFSSDIGSRMINSEEVKREMNFQVRIAPKALEDAALEKIVSTKNETYVVLQGTVDCFFREGDELVLIDYKTDYIDKSNREKLLERYALQLKYYKKALESLTGLKVKEEYLYFFYNSEIVKL